MAGTAKDSFTYPETLHDNDEGHWVLFTSYPHGQQGGGGQSQYSVALPMGAQSMITTAEAIYAEQEGLATMLTEASAAVATGTKSFDKTVGTKGGGGPEVDAEKGLFEKTKEIAASVLGEGGRQLLTKVDPAKRIAGGAFSVAANPKLALLYTGPGKFRKFVFEFPMIATSEKEAGTIEKIIKVFRFSTVPGFEKGIADAFNTTPQPVSSDKRNKGAGYNFFQFPSTWDIVFGHKDGEGGTPFKIARSVCNSVLVNYAAAGVPFFFTDGKPFEVKLTLTFTETLIITKELIQKGY